MDAPYSLLPVLLFCCPFLGFAQSILDLNGEWEIVFDDRNEGRSAHWEEVETFDAHPGRQVIQVPSAWELIKEDYEGVAFYKKAFSVPEDWEGKTIRLQFGAVNYLTEVWLNGAVVGFHEGGFTPFEFRVDEMITAGATNTLILRVVGPIMLTDKEVDGMGKMETPQWRGGLTGGIWQDVQLVATDEIYIKDVFIEPNIEQSTATFHLVLDHTGLKKNKISLDIFIEEASSSGDRIVEWKEEVQLHPGLNEYTYDIAIPNAQLWSPDNPQLYQAKLIVAKDAKISHSWTTRFGMREFTIKNKDFYLNGERIYIKATFFEGLYPNGIAAPDSEAMVRQEIQLAKEAGFNMIRPWRRPPVPMWLDMADEIGVLVVGSPALECMTLPLSTPYLSKRVQHEVRQSILRDRNRACIVQWELFNELHRPVLKQLMRPMAMLARDLDPTRLILDESGGWAFGANIYLPYAHEATQFNDIHNYPGPFINKMRYDGYLSIGLTLEEIEAKGYKGNKVGRNVVPGLMSFVSELGYGSLPDLTLVNKQFEKKGNSLTPAYRYHNRLHKEQQELLEESGFSQLYPDIQQFYLDQQAIHGAANKRMIEAVRANPEVDGYCIHALAAGDWILGAGLIDLWRNPKGKAYSETKAANQPRMVSIRLNPRNIYADKGAKLEIIGINDLSAVAASMKVVITNATGKIVYEKKLDNRWDSGISTLLEEELTTLKWEGEYQVAVDLKDKEKEWVTMNTYSFNVFSERQLKLPATTVALFEDDPDFGIFLEKQNVQVTRFDQNTSLKIPVFITQDYKDKETTSLPLEDLWAFVKKGGKVVYLRDHKVQGKLKDNHPAYPFTATIHPAQGLWTCMPHLVHAHPIFEGLPTNGPMRDIYENVWPNRTLRDIQIEGKSAIPPIVGTVAFDWFSREHKMQYSGPGTSWWGSELVELPYGKGTILVSQLRLLAHLGEDPVADRLVRNIIRYYAIP